MDKSYSRKEILLKSVIISMTMFIGTLMFLTLSFGANEKIDVQKAANISEIKKFLGINEWGVKEAILGKLDQIKNDESEKVEILYSLYMQEENEENNKIIFAGGEGPMHIRIQRQVLYKLMSLPIGKTRNRMLEIINNYISSVNGMDYDSWSISPKQALQNDIANVLISNTNDAYFRDMAQRYIESNRTKEYAKTRVMVRLLEYELLESNQNIDVNKKIEAILKTVANSELTKMLHEPKLISGGAEIMKKVIKDDMSVFDIFMESHEQLSESERYFLHYFISKYYLDKQELKLSVKDKTRIKKSVDFWFNVYPIISAREKYSSDLLSGIINKVGRRIGDKLLEKKIDDTLRQ